MDDIKDGEIQKLDLILERFSDVAALTCEAIDILIDTTEKLKENMVEAKRKSRKAAIAHVEKGDKICLDDEKRKLGVSGELASAERDKSIQQVIPAPSLTRNTVSTEGRVSDIPRATFPMFSGHQVRQVLCSSQHTILQDPLISEPNECAFSEHTETLQFNLLRESGECTRQRPSRSKESTILRHYPNHSLDQPPESSKFSSQGARLSEGRARNGDQRFCRMVEVPESILRVLNIIGTPRINHVVTYRETYGVQYGHYRSSAHEDKEAGDRKANGAKITEMPSASMPYREDHSCMNLSSILEPPIPTTNVEKMVTGVDDHGLRIISACQNRVKDLEENRGYIHFSTDPTVVTGLKEQCTPDPAGVNRQQVDGDHMAVIINQDAPERVRLARGHSRGNYARPSTILGKVVGLQVSIDLLEEPEGSNPILLQLGVAEKEVDYNDVAASPVDYNHTNSPVITSSQSRNSMEQKKEMGTGTMDEAQLPSRGKRADCNMIVEFRPTTSTMKPCLKKLDLRKEVMGAKIGQRGIIGANQEVVEGYPQVEKLPRFNYNVPSGILQEHNLVCTVDTGLRDNAAQAQWSEWLKEAKTEIKEESFWERDFPDPVLPDEPCRQGPLRPLSEDARDYRPEPVDALTKMKMLETSSPIRYLCRVPSVSKPTQEAKWVLKHKQKGKGDPPTSGMEKSRRVEEAPEKKCMWPRLQKMVDEYRTGVNIKTSKIEKKRKLTKIHDSPLTKRRTIEDFPAGSADRINRATQSADQLRRKESIAEMFRNRQQKNFRGKKAEPGPLTIKSSLNKSSKKVRTPASEPRDEWDGAHVKGHATHLKSTKADACDIVLPDAHYYDFDQDRTEGHVKKHQIWAVYDKFDGMPRSWVRVENVAQSPEFKAWVSWLQPHKLSPDALHWLESTGVNLSCGDFKNGESGILKGVKWFSHEMIAERRPDDVIRIYPRKGEVWALFSPNTGPRKTRANHCPILHSKYRLVEILTSPGGDALPELQEVGLLAGYRTIWQPIYAKPDVLPENNMELFSHRVPAYRMRDGGLKIPEGCWDVDPSGIPIAESLASSSKIIRRSSRS